MDAAGITIDGFHVDGQGFAYTVTVTGPPGTSAFASVLIFDGAGTQCGGVQLELGDPVVGAHSGVAPVSLTGLADGDYAAWLQAAAFVDETTPGAEASKGVSFLVGRGHLFPSGEAPPPIEHESPVTLGPIRMEGSWVVFDLTNPADHEVTVQHGMEVMDAATEHPFGDRQHHQELVAAKATQQAHYLLPDGMPDGDYKLLCGVSPMEADGGNYASLKVSVAGGIVTVAP